MKKVVSIIAVLAFATAAQAAIVNGPASISYASHPSDSLPGYTTYVVSATSVGGNFEGFDIDVSDPDGELNHHFMGNTVYQDFNFALTPAQIDQDTQVMIVSTTVMAVGARTAESATMLSATYAFNAGAADPLSGSVLEVVQVVLPDGSDANVRLNTLIMGQEYDVDVDVPEPASLALLGMGGLGVLLRRKR